ncbi:MAG: endonuclease YncB(thermonuclease family) [Oceanospirillaceae bacterium]|jgi:endonuclease YncB( thermonuclease family)
MNPIKHMARMSLACFCAVALFIVSPVSAQCPALSETQMEQALVWSGKPTLGNTYKVKSWYVQDGDSLSLANGHRLRLGQINTTEMASKEQPMQAYAQKGKDQLKQQLKQQDAIYLQLLPNIKDHYGRWLVKVYDSAGLSAEAFLVGHGLAYVISMDIHGAQGCLWQQEQAAREQGLGIWQSNISRVHEAAILTSNQSGFMRIRGAVTSISESKHYWYIGLGAQVAVKVAKDTLAASSFNITNPKQLERWVGQAVTVRGWLAWRKISKKQRANGFKAGVMSLYHLDMMEQGPRSLSDS